MNLNDQFQLYFNLDLTPFLLKFRARSCSTRNTFQEDEMTEKKQDETIKGRILGLLQKGYTRSQLID